VWVQPDPKGDGRVRVHDPDDRITEIGPVEIKVPRDRDGSFEPVIVPKWKRRLDGIDEVVVSLSSRGLTTGEIAAPG
jgi:transposase-like protein